MTEPYAGYHGIVVRRGVRARGLHHARARAEGLRDFGACMSPANAFYLLQGIETLPVRMARHVANAEAVARFLEKHAGRRLGQVPGAREPSRSRARQETDAQGRGRHHELRHQGRTQGRRQADRAAARCSRISPTSATPSRW